MPRVFRPGPLILATAVIGVLAGLGATGFHFVADRFVLLVPAIGLGLAGLLLQYYEPARLGGVREVFESIEHDGGVVPMRRIWNVVLSALVLAFGGSVRPEGPMVRMGAPVGSAVRGCSGRHVDCGGGYCLRDPDLPARRRLPVLSSGRCATDTTARALADCPPDVSARGAIIKGYWSGLMMVADMSGAYHALLLPGIIAGGISFLLSWELHGRPIGFRRAAA